MENEQTANNIKMSGRDGKRSWIYIPEYEKVMYIIYNYSKYENKITRGFVAKKLGRIHSNMNFIFNVMVNIGLLTQQKVGREKILTMTELGQRLGETITNKLMLLGYNETNLDDDIHARQS